MGIHNSSRTRVVPVFDQLLRRDSLGVSWLPRLLGLASLHSRNAEQHVLSNHPLIAWGWGRSEYALAPPRMLLRWLVTHATLPDGAVLGKTGITSQKRQLLLAQDAATIAQALTLLDQLGLPSRAWYILEGPTKPDVYLETADYIVVIEGKRTESGPTTHTTWMPQRHQMLRHLDCAWEQRGPKAVFGFFIVEGVGGPDDLTVPPRWQAAAEATITEDALLRSLPHRTSEERQSIAKSFLGITTWQALCAACDLDYALLPGASQRR